MSLSKKMMIVPAMVTVLFLNGCITEEKCNQRFPGSTRTETVFRDTVIITSSQRFDTLFRFGTDTVYLKDQKTKIEVRLIRVKGDSVFIRSECPPDTVIITKVRQETTVERVKNLFSFSLKKLIWPILLFILLLISLGYLLNSLKK